MVFNTGAALLDAIVLAVVSNDAEGTYGYKITQDVRQAIEISESTLYPVRSRWHRKSRQGFPKALPNIRRRAMRIPDSGIPRK